jgi:hypothetical protein
MYFTDDSLLPENQAPLMITAAPYELARAKGWREAILTRLRELSAAHKQAGLA